MVRDGDATTHQSAAVELKIGESDARQEGQLKLYLKWLNRYER